MSVPAISAALFPGQGAQYVGMGREAYHAFAEVRDALDRASEILGMDLARLCFEGPKETLDLTENAQPAIFALSYGLYRAAWNTGFRPRAGAGLSLGEYTALAAADALDFEEAAALVRLRGKLMQEAVPVGAGGMVAVMGLDREKVERACLEASKWGVVEPANYNSPGQIVISGDVAALERAVEACIQMGARRTASLSVSAPFHSSLMRPAAGEFSARLRDARIRRAAFPVIANASAEPVRDPGDILDGLIRQMSSPVLWEQSVEVLLDMGATALVEFGPSRSLSGLIKRIRPGTTKDIISIETPEDLEKFKKILEGPKGAVLA